MNKSKVPHYWKKFDDLKYTINISDIGNNIIELNWDEISDWCKENQIIWAYCIPFFYFKTKNDRMSFMLRWSH
jgi:valyl-tRNA synthetase